MANLSSPGFLVDEQQLGTRTLDYQIYNQVHLKLPLLPLPSPFF
jgi:hypothetical protein